MPAEQRADFLQQVGVAGHSIRADLKRMLIGDQQARGEQLLQEPCPVNARDFFSPACTVVSSAPEPEDSLVGVKIGPYRIEQRIGHGGMGTVYRARREEGYQQRVALKVIRPGLDSGELLGRFQTDRQVLAELEHPHIARLLDGGTLEDGRPYFVMEHIDGQPLDRFCEQRLLGTAERLRLLQAVCAAVQHAHEHGILHREAAEELSSDLDRWCYFFRHGADLDLERLPPSLDVPPIRRALEVLTVFTQDEREREAYEASLKFQRDQNSLLAEAAEAEERGTKKGMEKGLEQGALIGEIRLSQQLLKMPQSAEAELTQMSIEDLMALRAQLLKQLLPEST